MSVVYLLLLLLLGCLHANSAHPSSCPPSQFSCGNYTWNVSSPFFTTNSATNPGCRKVHCIYCETDSPVVRFYNTGYVLGGLWFTWKLSFGGAYEGRNDGSISLLSGGFSHNWDLHPDCFGCEVTASDSCTTSGDPGDLDSRCQCTKQCQDDGKGAQVLRKRSAIIGITVGSVCLLLIALFFFICLLRKNRCDLIIFSKKISEDEQMLEAILQNYDLKAPKRYKHSEIKKITQRFNNEIGKGGFGTVFKGKLVDGRDVAVKVLHESNGKGEDFVNEILSISKTSHLNVVMLLGFCFERCSRALIYEFVPNGTLSDFIDEEKSNMEASILWERLHDIAIGIARGLEYLHRGCSTPIVHFDIKPHNILLDKKFRPKIADFGLAKLCSTRKSALSIQGKGGTPGYIAPELWFDNFGPISSKADVYSYGKIVLEMVGGRKLFNSKIDSSSVYCFTYWVYDHLNQCGNLDAYGVTEETVEVAKKMILVGLWCIQKLPAERPSMSQVVEMLEGRIEDLRMPPNPKWF
uniref:Protein kinase domain-containing protein n=1 Tax=Ananas comosus var. bracteatus TaxID=296719 RepID=A0A6V7PWH0_ANACO|nr:unnamed protein product [Ananas comosus var. bracteatus]